MQRHLQGMKLTCSDGVLLLEPECSDGEFCRTIVPLGGFPPPPPPPPRGGVWIQGWTGLLKGQPLTKQHKVPAQRVEPWRGLQPCQDQEVNPVLWLGLSSPAWISFAQATFRRASLGKGSCHTMCA